MTDRNWLIVPDSHDLNWHIAELVGWTTTKSGDGYLLITPYASRFGLYVSERDAQAHAPHYSTNLNAALALPVDDGAGIELHVHHKQSCARVPVYAVGRQAAAEPDWETNNSAALAVCRAWLAYRTRIGLHA